MFKFISHVTKCPRYSAFSHGTNSASNQKLQIQSRLNQFYKLTVYRVQAPTFCRGIELTKKIHTSCAVAENSNLVHFIAPKSTYQKSFLRKCSKQAARSPSPLPSTEGKTPPKDYSLEIIGTRTEQRVKMNRIRRTIADNLKKAQNVYVPLTSFNEIDMTSAMEFRKAYLKEFTKKFNTKIGYVSIFSKAAVYALMDQPVLNAAIDGSDIVFRDYIDISVAISGPKGLVGPCIRNVESMDIADIEIAMAALVDKTRKGKITMEDLQGGTFVITNGGVFGSLMSTPMLTLPRSCILGMHGIFDRPVVVKNEVVVRPMMYIALTYDHRLIDGREAALFLRKLKAAVEEPRVILAAL